MGRRLSIRTTDQFRSPIWEQQKQAGETDEYYVMFLTYSDLKPIERTLSRCWRVFTEGSNTSKKHVSSKFKEVSKAFLWAERASAKDIHEIKSRYKTWSERDWDWRENDYQFGSKLRLMAEHALNEMEMDDKTMELSDIVKLYQIASDLQKSSVPKVGQINSNQIGELLSMLPTEKKDAVLKIVMAEMTVGKKKVGRSIVELDPDWEEEIVDAEFTNLANDDEIKEVLALMDRTAHAEKSDGG